MNSTQFPSLPVLLVDDEEQFLLSASFILNAEGMSNIVRCQDSRDVMPLLSKQDFAVIVLDILMPHISGSELLPMIVQDFPGTPIVITTAINEVETAVECMKSGTFDYLVKPVDDARLTTTVKRAIELKALRNENTLLKQYLLSDKLEHSDAFSKIITQNRVVRSIFQYVEAIARTSMPVLITGETGVGKELIAGAIHTLSGRDGEFTPVNVAGVDDHLFSDTLFGHQRGAFTGADGVRKGLIEQAADGTLFLDEIGDLSIESQVKLLRLLQEGKYYPLGGDMPKLTDARIIVATNREIESMMERGKFRKDLYYRLQTHHIHLPPLRERRDDIPLLVEHFLERSAEALGKKKPTCPKELLTLLDTYHFPGNIRELEGMVFDAVSRHKSGVLSTESFRTKMPHKPPAPSTRQTDGAEYLQDFEPGSENPQVALNPRSEGSGGETASPRILFTAAFPTLKEAEQAVIAEALKRAKGNQTIAAQLLGVSRRALNNRLRRSHK